MKNKTSMVMLIAVLACHSGLQASRGAVHIEASQEIQEIFSSVVMMIEPSLVNISAMQVESDAPFYFFFRGQMDELFDNGADQVPDERRRIEEGSASGFIISREGLVLTNYHVVRGADELRVTLSNQEEYDAEIVGIDPYTDLAVIKINSDREFQALEMGDSDDIGVGYWVVAAGSPFGLNNTYTTGIISGMRQNIQVEDVTYQNLFQTDAAINKGNSGGPLVNLKGEVIGVNSAIFAPTGVFSGIGFAIPINQAKKILNELIDSGRVTRGWLGIEIADIDPGLQQALSLETSAGAVITGIMPGSPADEGGLMEGDIVVSVGGRAIAGTVELQNAVAETRPGEETELTVIRNGKRLNLTVRLGERD